MRMYNVGTMIDYMYYTPQELEIILEVNNDGKD